MKFTEHVESINGPPCAPTCDPKQTQGDKVGTAVHRCVEYGTPRWYLNTQYVYRFDKFGTNKCHYHATQIPSALARTLGFGLPLGFLALTLVFIVIMSPVAALFLVALILSARYYYYITEPSLKEAMDITYQLIGPVNEYNWDFSQNGDKRDL